ncbi:lasso peptide biosynthesis PqqD family chaperone [Streptomyces enissocaesilis]|uniref:Lasso peptide biosynthesis PqqD family chaperone n=1 Tax=Streptomyces enissocaesilis TaxID=332589 RepID=A0ABP6K8S8_9ACTN
MKLRIPEQVSAVDTEYGTVLLDERSGKYWQLTPSASVVLNELKSGGDINSAVAALARRFEVDEATARRDTLALVERLRSLGVVAS